MNKQLSKYFFLFDSDSFESIQDAMYGFGIYDLGNKVVISNSCNAAIDPLNGCYILVKHHGNEVVVSQDELCSLYVYYYVDSSYWAVSNSFHDLCQRLVEKGKKLTINNDYIEQYFHNPLQPISLQTMAIEVFSLQPFCSLCLTKFALKVVEKRPEFESVDLCSQEGLELLDSWIDRWCKIIKAMYDSGVKMMVDLSGGFDSRVIFSLANYAGVDFHSKTVNLRSKIGQNKGTIAHLADDYEVASRIADRLGYYLNQNDFMNGAETMPRTSSTQYEILRNLFMFTHKEGYLCIKVRKEPMVHLGGMNGEFARRKLDNFVNASKKCCNDPFLGPEHSMKIFNTELDNVARRSHSTFERNALFYIGTQGKSHYGHSIYNDLLCNIFAPSPFNDISFLKFRLPPNVDSSLIFALIVRRTTPAIFDIEFSSGGKFPDEVVQLTLDLCKKYPKKLQSFTGKDVAFTCNCTPESSSADNWNGMHVAYDLFCKNRQVFVDYIGKLWGETYANKMYDHAKAYFLNRDNFHGERWLMVVTSIIDLLLLLEKK